MKRRDFNRIALGASLSFLLANSALAQTSQNSSPSQTTAKDDPMVAVRQYIDAFNKGDKDTMAATCAPTSSILDGMAPHVWQGPTACQDWYRDVLAEGEQHGASGYFVTLGTPRHVNISGDNAYVVVPASMTFKVNGKQISQTGATFTVALRKLGDGWRIAAWAWAKGGQ